MKPIDFGKIEIFKNLKRKMSIAFTKEDVLLNHPNVLNYLNKYQGIKNGNLISNEITEINLQDYINILNNGIIVDNETQQNVVFYMYTQRADPSDSDYSKSESNYRFHISFCKTVKEHINKTSRWAALRKLNDIFEIKEIPSQMIVNKKMKVCRNCLKNLNYKNFNNVSNREKNNIINNFSLYDFFEEYDNNFIYVPNHLKKEYQDFQKEYQDTYTDDWKEISRDFREAKKWICEKCKKDFSHDKFNLHVHHKDHNKSNNNYSNLMCLCKSCHSNMPGHEHMKK